jgi:hypothetical protein
MKLTSFPILPNGWARLAPGLSSGAELGRSGGPSGARAAAFAADKKLFFKKKLLIVPDSSRASAL